MSLGFSLRPPHQGFSRSRRPFWLLISLIVGTLGLTGIGSGNAQVVADGTIRVDARAAKPFTNMKWGTNGSFFTHPYYYNSQLAARSGQITDFIRFPGGVAAQDWGWASCELSPTPGAVTYGTPCFPAGQRNLTTDPLVRVSEFFKWVNQAGIDEIVMTLNANATKAENAALMAFSLGQPTDTRVIGVDQLGVDWKTVGFWAQKRVDAGVANPMNIKIWEFGNETQGGKGHPGCLSFGWETVFTCSSVEFYEGKGTGAARKNGYAETKTFVKSFFPTIQLGIAGTIGELNTANPWMAPLINRAGNDIDFLIIHTYFQFSPPPNTPAGNATILGFPQYKISDVDTALSAMEANAGVTRKIPVLVSEYGLTSEGWEEREGMRISQMLNALLIGDSIGQIALNDRFIGSNQFTLAYESEFGNEFGLMGFKNANYQDAYRYPTYYAMNMWQRFGTSIKGVVSSFNASSELSVYAGEKSGKTTLLVFNKTNTAKSATISIDGKTIASELAHTFAGTTINDTDPKFNGLAAPADNFSDAPGVTTNRGNASSYIRSFPAASITLLELTTDGSGTSTTTSTTTTTTIPPNNPPFVSFTPARLLETRPGESTYDGQSAGIGLRAAGTTTQVQLTGRAGIPADAQTVWLNVTVTQPTAAGHITVYPCGTAMPTASNLNYTAGTTIAASVAAAVGTSGMVCVYNAGPTHVIVDANAYSRSSSFYSASQPARLMDSRPGATTIDTQFAGTGVVAADSTMSLRVAGRGGVAANALAATLNFTVTQPSAAGHITVYPCGTVRPLVSTLNFSQGQTIANSAVARPGTSGDVCIYTTTATHLIVDVNGAFPSGSSFTTLSPSRLVDSRPGTGTIDGQQVGFGLIPAGSTTEVIVGGRAGMPATPYAVTMNMTVTQPAAAGHLTVYPCGTTRPNASNINFTAGQTIANAVVAKVGSNGRVCVYNASATHLIMDATGYVP
jgi:hypothetical protein